MIEIVSYNVNGIRAAERKGFSEWLDGNNYEVVCIQETKAHKEQFDESALAAQGYHSYWHSAQKKGYSGVAIYTKRKPKHVEIGCGIEKYDFEGRIIRADFEDWSIMNCYFPSGTSGDERQAFKMEFLEDFFVYIEHLKKEIPNLIVVGDYNVAHTENDIHNPKTNKNTSGFKPEERAWMTKWFESGFTDAFRHCNPEMTQYSWWSYRAGARKNNKGWRIDYQSVAQPISDKIVEAHQLTDVVHSDHCPVWLKIDL